MADYRRRLAEAIQREREAQGLSREALAARSDVTEKTIERIEAEKTLNPRPVTIRRLAVALGVDPSELRPPPEIEEDQLTRIESKLDRVLDWIEAQVAQEAEDALGLDEDQGPRRGEAQDG